MAVTGSAVLPLCSTRPGLELSTNARFTSPRPSKQPRLAKPNPPQPLSIRDILRKHSRERLVVNPLRWTAQQLQLLECHFRRREVPGCPNPMNGNLDQQPLPDNSHAKAIDDVVRKPTTQKFKASVIGSLLADYGINRVGNCPELFFDCRRVTSVRTDGVFAHSISKTPNLTFLDLQTHAERRETYFIPRAVYKGRSSASRHIHNAPVIRFGKKKLCRVKPTVEVEDPYIVAVLIALTQEQRDYRPGKAWVTGSR